MKLKIIPSPSDPSCSCSSWLEHWENTSKWKALLCSEKYCRAYAAVGTPVQKIDGSGATHYTIPLCTVHNNMKGREIEVIDVIKLAPVGNFKTCGNGRGNGNESL